MKIIIPMAGRGSRLRPHTLSTPKPLISVAGEPIVNQLLDEIAKIARIPITDIGFILGDPVYFGKEIEKELKKLAKKFNATAHIFRQKEPLGTGHAIMCASEILSGPTIVAYADTLIRANRELDLDSDATIWVKKVDKPEDFGVVELNYKRQIINLIESGISEGATLAAGGPDRPNGLNKGYFIKPTIFTDVTNDMRIAKEEIFGPVLSIIPFEKEEDAIKIVNDTSYGLGNYLQTENKEKAHRVAKELRSGCVYINGKGADPGTPFGGYRQSGNGREGGVWGLEEYLEVKTVTGWK